MLCRRPFRPGIRAATGRLAYGGLHGFRGGCRGRQPGVDGDDPAGRHSRRRRSGLPIDPQVERAEQQVEPFGERQFGKRHRRQVIVRHDRDILERDTGLCGGGCHEVARPDSCGPLPRHRRVEHRPLVRWQRGQPCLAGRLRPADQASHPAWHDPDRRIECRHLAAGDRGDASDHLVERFLPALQPDRGVGIEPAIHQHGEPGGVADPAGPLSQADAAPGRGDGGIEIDRGCRARGPEDTPEEGGTDRKQTGAADRGRSPGRRQCVSRSRLSRAPG